ncbi:zinc finger protein 501-like isoform X2 [Melanotaenia boesemani]|uniref:zinc finger protein 501-like isoform X2 n=1 Tax=Melanotaenia boesemani TaxID=1250792 RepID=UPI001C041E2A|nr:zinc finger protein 501-like isoform X2 [Melanotaenia boesemani]
MSSVQHLREFISERLTAAAEEIFTEFEKTIVQYEEEIDRQRRLLDTSWKPRLNIQTTDVPQQHACKEDEALDDQQLCNQERTSSLNQEEPELPQIKEEQEELCTSQEAEQLVLKQETDTFILTQKYQDFSQAETNTGKFFCHNSLLTKSFNNKDGSQSDMGSASDGEMNPKQRLNKKRWNCNSLSCSPVTESQTDTESLKTSVKCDVCGKAFSGRCSMEKHHAVHAGVKPYACKTCGKCFSHNRTLLTHLRIHTGEKLFPCKTCGKCFTRRSDLLTHMRIHSGERPFSCGTCGKRFKQKSYMTVHMRVHTGEAFYCEICAKYFRYKKSLTVHMRTHTGKKLNA